MKTAALQIFTIQFDKHKDNEGTVVGDRNIKYSGLCKHVNASRESASLESLRDFSAHGSNRLKVESRDWSLSFVVPAYI